MFLRSHRKGGHYGIIFEINDHHRFFDEYYASDYSVGIFYLKGGFCIWVWKKKSEQH
jgi:hypothetical protein